MIIAGLVRLGADAELRYTQQNEAVCNIRVAFSHGKKDGGGKRPAQWIDASLWGKRAEAMAPHLKKGVAVDIVASDPHIEEFDGRNGKGFKLVARIVEIEFAGGGQSGGQDSRPAESTSVPKSTQQTGCAFSDFEDDIPF